MDVDWISGLSGHLTRFFNIISISKGINSKSTESSFQILNLTETTVYLNYNLLFNRYISYFLTGSSGWYDTLCNVTGYGIFYYA